MVDSYEAKLKKVAVIISDSVLHKIQVQRIGSAERQAFFRTEDEAVAWLFAE